MTDITDREALYLSDLLNQQVLAVDKFSVYANECTDPELRSICREIANVNVRHFDRLLQQVSVSGTSTNSQIGAATRFTQMNTYPSTSQYGGINYGMGNEGYPTERRV